MCYCTHVSIWNCKNMYKTHIILEFIHIDECLKSPKNNYNTKSEFLFL